MKNLNESMNTGVRKEDVRIRLSEIDYWNNEVGFDINTGSNPVNFTNTELDTQSISYEESKPSIVDLNYGDDDSSLDFDINKGSKDIEYAKTESNTQSIFYEESIKRNKKKLEEEEAQLIVDNNEYKEPVQEKVEKSVSQKQDIPSVENNNTQSPNTGGKDTPKGKGKQVGKSAEKLVDPNMPYHLTTPEELRRKKLEAIDRTVPRGSISGGFSGLQANVADIVETMLRRSFDNNALIDHYFYMDNQAHRVAFEKYELNKDKENGLIKGFVGRVKDIKDNRSREKQLKEIANAIEQMELKVPNEENLKDVQMLLNMVQKNPEFDVEKMSKEEKKFFEKVIVPMAEEAREKGLDFKDILNNKETQKQFDDLYGKHKTPQMKKEVDYEIKKTKAMKLGYGM